VKAPSSSISSPAACTMTDLISPTCSGTHAMLPEVETEFEEEEEEFGEDRAAAHEVEEELESEARTQLPTDTDYTLPTENRDIWRNFGHGSEAGRALRKLYASTGQKDAASRVSYPRLASPATRWQPSAGPSKPCPQRAAVRVPAPLKRPGLDRDDPRNWRVPLPGRKPAAEILAEMERSKPSKPNLEPGRDQAAAKRGLQDRFRYCGGRALPKGVMGNVADADMPDPEDVRKYLPERWDHIDESGLTREQREIFVEITKAISYKQSRLKEIDAEEKADPVPSKAKTNRNKEALQLQNDINRCVSDIDKLLELTEQGN